MAKSKPKPPCPETVYVEIADGPAHDTPLDCYADAEGHLSSDFGDGAVGVTVAEYRFVRLVRVEKAVTVTPLE